MNILLIAPYIPWESKIIGGGPITVDEYAERLGLKGHNVTVIYPSRCDLSEIQHNIPNDLHYDFVRVRYGDYLYVCFSILKATKLLLSERRFDIIHAHFYGGVLLKNICRKYRCPYVVSTHYPKIIAVQYKDLFNVKRLIHWRSHLLYLLADRQNCLNADLVIATCEYIKNQLSQNYGVSLKKIRIVPTPAIDEKMIAEGFRRKYKMSIPPKLLFVGGLGRQKGVDILLQAANLLIKRGIDFKLEIVGPGKKDFYENLARKFGIIEKLRFYGRIERDRLFNFYKEADIFVLPSRADGLNLVCMEALSFGLPVISTLVGGIPEIVDDGVTGLLVKPEDAFELAKAIEYLIRNPQVAEVMSRRGPEQIKDKFSPDKSVEKLEEIYMDLLA